jgi:hypothetical protein
MIDSSDLYTALERLAPRMEVERDWEDVLRRSRSIRLRVLRTRRPLILAIVSIALLPAAAFASSYLSFSSHPSLRVGATIDNARLNATFSAQPRRTFAHIGSGKRSFPTRQLDWTLVFQRSTGSKVTAELVLPTGRVTLCARCKGQEYRGAYGGLGVWLQILDGRGYLRLTVDGETFTAKVRRE